LVEDAIYARRDETLMAAQSDEDEASIDARLKETEKSIAELQKKRAELLRAKGAIRWAKTTASTSKNASPRASTPAAVAKVTTVASTNALEKTLKSLEWSSFKKKEGEWTFLRKRDGALVDTLESEADFVNQLRKGKQLVVGKYRYVVSEDKFLNRYFEA
jgi:leucyl aminopeptidase (aminopeptidase T)